MPNNIDSTNFQEIYQAIDSVLINRATAVQASIKVGDKEIRYIPLPELLELRKYYYRLYRQASGKDRPKTIHAIFKRS